MSVPTARHLLVSVLVTATVVSVLSMTSTVPAGALQKEVCRLTADGEWECHWITLPDQHTPGPGDGGKDTPSPTTYLYWAVDFKNDPTAVDEAGNPTDGCWMMVVTKVSTTPPPPDETFEGAKAELAELGDNGDLWAACPPDPVTPPFDPVAATEQFWREEALPPLPSPVRIDPKDADPRNLVSFKTYVTIIGNRAPQFHLDNPIGPEIVITAKPRYVIDWGDRTTSGSTTFGEPYPGGPGEITHVYLKARTYTITVRAYWSATWKAGNGGDGLEGNLPELPNATVAPARTIRVIQAQAQTGG
jgi:hypothetical protein